MLPKINHKHCNWLYIPLLFEALMVPLKKRETEREREREKKKITIIFPLVYVLSFNNGDVSYF